MNRKTIILVIVLMSISLIGIIAVQVFWIKNAIDVKAEQFDHSVNDAMNDVVQRLEKNENLIVLSDNFSQIRHNFNYQVPNLDSIMSYQFVVIDSLGERVKHLTTIDKKLQWMEQDYQNTYEMYSWIDSMGSQLEVSISMSDDMGDHSDNPKKKNKKDVFAFKGDGVYVVGEGADTSKVMVRAESKIHLKTNELNNMINQMVVEVEAFSAPISQRLDKQYLAGQVQKSLSAYGIAVPFEFAVVSGIGKELIPVKSDNFDDNGLDTPYRVSLFPNDIFEKPNYLLLSFPDMSSHLYKSIFLLLLGSLVFTLIIIFTFFVTIWVILQQKKISEIKSDFINNMTHEFKTPIATISLAVDSIDSPKILNLPDKIKYFTSIIRDENRRMNKQVENVLQMAMIDKRDFKLHIREIDTHDIIRRTADHLSLQLEKKHGNIKLHLDAINPVIESDELHFSNIINNLLDNAIKYTRENPEIEISTENTAAGIKIAVQDNGIGISKEEQEKIFDKFFRVATGNVHNVKGFGLGLSYVKALVLTFGGNIKVKSEPGNGSRFEIYLPSKAERGNG